MEQAPAAGVTLRAIRVLAMVDLLSVGDALLGALVLGEVAHHQHEEQQRTKKMASTVALIIPHHAGADGVAAAGAGPGADHQRQHAEG